MSRVGLIDTGPLVAGIDRSDRFHGWALEALGRFPTPLKTCDAVVSEAWFLLGRARKGRDALLGMLNSGDLSVSFSLAEDGRSALKLMAKYSDQPMSVADACLVRMTELDPSATIITLDRDFLVYRRGRSPLKLAAPFGH